MMVRVCDQIKWPSSKKIIQATVPEYQGKKKKKAKEKMGGQHQKLDRPRFPSTSVREQPRTVRDGRRLWPMSAVVPLVAPTTPGVPGRR